MRTKTFRPYDQDRAGVASSVDEDDEAELDGLHVVVGDFDRRRLRYSAAIVVDGIRFHLRAGQLISQWPRFTFVCSHEEIETAPSSFVVVSGVTLHCSRARKPHSGPDPVVPAGLAECLPEMANVLAAEDSPVEAVAAPSSRYDSHPLS